MATYTFEGIGLAIPIRNSMRHPEDFRKVWVGTLAGLTLFFIIFGALGYAAYGEGTNSVGAAQADVSADIS